MVILTNIIIPIVVIVIIILTCQVSSNSDMANENIFVVVEFT